MIPSTGTLGDVPLGALSALDASTPDVFQELLASGAGGIIFLVEAMPYDVTAPITVAGLPAPGGVQAVAAGPTFDALGGETKTLLSDKGFLTKATDDPAHTHYPARLGGELEFSGRLYTGDEPHGSASAQFGELEIQNGDGALDAWLDYAWEGRQVLVKGGLPGWDLNQFGVLLAAEAGQPEWNYDNITLPLRDLGQRLERAIQQQTYDGSGGLGGSEQLAGARKPLAFGELVNVRPVLLDANLVLYQVHDGAIGAVGAAYDKGIALTADGDKTLAQILDPGTSISAGGFITHLDKGLVRLNATPDGQLTLDLTGDTAAGNTIGSIVREIVQGRLGVSSLADTQIDAGAFNDFNAAQTATIGLLIAGGAGSGEPTASNILDQLMASAGGAWSTNRVGQLTISRLEAPGSGTATLTEANIIEGSLIRRGGDPPSWRRRVGWGRAWLVQGDEDLAAAAPDALRERVAQAMRFAEATESSVLGQNPLARDVETEGFFDSEADALAEAERLESLHAPRRDLYDLTQAAASLQTLLGQTVVLEVPRFGLAAGRAFVVIEEEQQFFAETKTLTLWG